MRIKQVRLHNFRNLQTLLTLGPGINVFHGRNGQGKTNVLEGIYFAGYGKSFRPGRLVDLVQFGHESASVEVAVEESGVITHVRAELQGSNRQHFVEETATASMSEVGEHLRLVFFGPDDLSMVKGAPSQRREFLDRAIAGHHPPYLTLLKGYSRLLRERNNLLRELGSGRFPPQALLESYEEEGARFGAQIVEYRLKYLREFIPAAQRFMNEHTDGALALTANYAATTQLPEDGTIPEREDIAERLLSDMQQRRGPDSAAGSSCVGPHLDDLDIQVNEKPARYFASQGEQRQVAVSFKLAQLSLWKERFQVLPILLLDDVSSELDRDRTRLLFDLITTWNIQTIISTTSIPDMLRGENSPGHFYEVETGKVTPAQASGIDDKSGEG